MKDPGFLRAAASAAARVTELTVSVVLGTWAGSWMDETLGTTPWLLLLGVCLGTAVGLAALARGAKETAVEPDEH